MLYSSLRFTFTSKDVRTEGKLEVHLSRSSKLFLYCGMVPVTSEIIVVWLHIQDEQTIRI